MDRSVIEQYLAEVPYQVRLAVKPLSNDKSWAILIALLKDGDMRFSDIKRKFKAESSGDIDRFLKQLIQSGLITNQVTNYDEIFDNTKSLYSATPIGAAVVHSLNRALSPSFNHAFMNNMQNQKITFKRLRIDEMDVPNNLKRSIQAKIPQNYKILLIKKPSTLEEINHKIMNKHPIRHEGVIKMSETEKTQPDVVLEKADDYRIIYVDGVYGELDPNRGILKFFNDTTESDINSDLSLKSKQYKRTVLFELRMSPETWMDIANWMVDYSNILNNWREKELEKRIEEKMSKKKK